MSPAHHEADVFASARSLAKEREWEASVGHEEPPFQRLARLAAQLVATPVAAVCLVSQKGTSVAGAFGIPEPRPVQPATAHVLRLSRRLIERGAPLSVRDGRSFDEWQNGGRDGFASWAGVPFYDESGVALGVVCVLDLRDRLWTRRDLDVLSDIAALAATESRRLRDADALREATSLVKRHETTRRAFFETAPLMMGLVETLPGDVIHIIDNSTTARFFGSTPEAMQGRRATELGADATSIGRWLTAYNAAIRSQQPVEFDYQQEVETGMRTLSVTVSYIGRAQSGNPLCSYVAVDVTEQREAERALAETEQGLQLALRAGQMGAWHVDISTGHTVLSDAIYDMYGLEDEVTSLQKAYDIVDPTDRARVEDEFDKAIRETNAAGTPTDVITQYRVAVDGRRRWFRTAARVYPGAHGASSIAGTVIDVTNEIEHKATLVEARERERAAKQEAEAAARLRQSILHNMSHEIRTPLTAVVGYADLLAEEVSEEDRDLVACIQSASSRLLETLNSVLTHARLEAGHGGGNGGEPIAVEPLDAAEAARSAVFLFKQRVSDSGVDLRLDVEPCLVLADSGALQRLLVNLVSNAVKFTDEGSISVSVRRDADGVLSPDGDVVLSVADTGIGMSPEFLASAFQPFHQESTGHTRSHEGTGLGLAIVRRLVEMMGGTVRVKSAQGVGTTFEVRLRAAAPASGAETRRQRPAA